MSREVRMIEEIAQKIVEQIINDLTDRSGLGSEWWQIDDEIQDEIKQTWIDIIVSELQW